MAATIYNGLGQVTLELHRLSFLGNGLCLEQPSPTVSAPGTSFVKENCSLDWGKGDGFRMIKAHCIYYVLSFSIYIIHLGSSNIRSQRLGTIGLEGSLGINPYGRREN